MATGSISPTFDAKFLCVQIPQAKKDTDDLTVFFALSESLSVKAAHEHVGEIDPIRQKKRVVRFFTVFNTLSKFSIFFQLT